MNSRESQFPDAFTPDQLFNGVPFNQLHIINVKSTRNNTIMSMTDHKGKPDHISFLKYSTCRCTIIAIALL